MKGCSWPPLSGFVGRMCARRGRRRDDMPLESIEPAREGRLDASARPFNREQLVVLSAVAKRELGDLDPEAPVGGGVAEEVGRVRAGRDLGERVGKPSRP